VTTTKNPHDYAVVLPRVAGKIEDELLALSNEGVPDHTIAEILVTTAGAMYTSLLFMLDPVSDPGREGFDIVRKELQDLIDVSYKIQAGEMTIPADDVSVQAE
jgi:hypothetical protein